MPYTGFGLKFKNLLLNRRIVKIATTKAQRKIFYNLRKLTQSNQMSESEIQYVAEQLSQSYRRHTNVTKNLSPRPSI